MPGIEDWDTSCLPAEWVWEQLWNCNYWQLGPILEWTISTSSSSPKTVLLGMPGPFETEEIFGQRSQEVWPRSHCLGPRYHESWMGSSKIWTEITQDLPKDWVTSGQGKRWLCSRTHECHEVWLREEWLLFVFWEGVGRQTLATSTYWQHGKAPRETASVLRCLTGRGGILLLSSPPTLIVLFPPFSEKKNPQGPFIWNSIFPLYPHFPWHAETPGIEEWDTSCLQAGCVWKQLWNCKCWQSGPVLECAIHTSLISPQLVLLGSFQALPRPNRPLTGTSMRFGPRSGCLGPRSRENWMNSPKFWTDITEDLPPRSRNIWPPKEMAYLCSWWVSDSVEMSKAWDCTQDPFLCIEMSWLPLLDASS